MGIQGLNLCLLKHTPKSSKAIDKVFIEQNKHCILKNKKIVIDASIYIYKFFVKSNYNNLKTNLNIMLDDFKKCSITPIFIFDGKSLDAKSNMIKQRRDAKILAEKEYLKRIKDGDFANAKELENSFIYLTIETISFVKHILNNRGIKYIDAPNEADPLCVWMVNNNKAWACMSDDTDMFIYGCKRVLRSYSLTTKSIMIYDFEKMLIELKLSFNEFRDICVVAGTDYNIDDNIDINRVFDLFNLFKTADDNDDDDFLNWLYNNRYITNVNNYYEILDIMDITKLSY